MNPQPSPSAAPPPKLLGQVIAKMRRRHYSKRTESAYVDLYQKILEIELPKPNALRAQRPEHLPVVPSIEEIRAILAAIAGSDRLMAELLYGAGGVQSPLDRL